MTSAHDRITKGQNAVGISFFTPEQAAFRQTIGGGRWASDPTDATSAPACHVKMHDDGTMDVIRLDTMAGGWLDLGGIGGRDAVAGRY